MEVILNNSKRPYHMTINVRGKMVTVTLAPGASRVKKEYIKPLRGVKMFAKLEADNMFVVGVKASDDTLDAREIPGIKAAKAAKAAKKPAPEPAPETAPEPAPETAAAKKAAAKKAAAKDVVGDLTDL